MSELLRCFEIEPEAGTAAGSVLWMHGLGANGHDFEEIVPLLRLPRARFVFPHAPQRPVTINAGVIMPAWYDILDIGGPRGENPRQVRESAAQVEALIAREAERGVPAERLVLAGFSQGGALALFVGARHPRRLAGIMALSAYDVLADTLAAEASPENAATPTLFCHGRYDPVVPLAAARQAHAARAAGGAAEWHEFPMGHEMSLPEIEVIRNWLAARFAAAPGGA
jgi:phospholipase/carboxylesterase